MQGVLCVAIYHLHVSIISRKTGRSSVGASAYRAGEKLYNEHDGITHDYSNRSSTRASAYRSGEKINEHNFTNKRGVIYSEIILPENVPREFADRATLWNAVEKSEKRKDAQTARDIDVALPVEFSRQEQIQIMREYVQENFVDKGMIADFAIHDKNDGNPHAHIMLTTRDVDKNGFKGKNRDWNKPEYLKSWRENWSDKCNEKLQQKGLNERINHRTLEAQGIDREPTIHIGVQGKALERKGIITEKVRKNREIIERNKAKAPENIAESMYKLKENHIMLEKEIHTLQAAATDANRELNTLRVQAEEITERANNIQNMKKQLDKLKTERQTMGVLKSKSDIDNQIRQFEQSYNQATAYFRQEYKFSPEQSATEIKRLESNIMSKKHLQEKLQDKLKPLVEQKELTTFQYQRQKLLVDIRPDKEQVYNRLIELEKESQVYKNLVKDDLLRLRCERQLDVISEQNFQKILQETEQRELLMKQRESERLRERVFSRNR